MEEENIVAEFRRLIDVELQAFLDVSQQLGEPIFGLANMVKRAFRNLLSFIIDGVSMERPDDARFKRMTELLGSEIADIQSFRDRNRQIQEVFNHLSTVSESIVALSWISVSNSPVQFVRDMRDAGQYFGNRVLSQYKGNQLHQEWINKWNKVLSALEVYVLAFHKTGFSWNAVTRIREFGKPTVAGDAGVGLSQAVPPPPPPPRAMDLMPEGGDTRQNLLRDLNQGVDIVRRSVMPEGGDTRQNLLRDLNQGVDIVRRNVLLDIPVPLSPAYSTGSTGSSSAFGPLSSPEILSDSSSAYGAESSSSFSPKSDTTSFGPSSPDLTSSPESVIEVPVRSPANLPTADLPLPRETEPEISALVADLNMLKPVNREQPCQSQQALPSTSGENLPRKPISERTYPPKFLLDGRKWRIEHQKDRLDLVIDNAEMSHSLAMFKCQNYGVQVRNKLNGVSIDNCKRGTVVLSDIISAVELIGCQHMKLHCIGRVPLVSVDNCDSVEIYLENESLHAEIISSKSTSLNISLKKSDGDFIEMPVPEQIKTVVVNGKLVSNVVEKM